MQDYTKKDNYKRLLIDTLEELYPNYLKKKIIKKMADSGSVVNSKRNKKGKQFNIGDVIDVSEIKGEDSKLKHILSYDEEENLFKYIEEFEFDKSYKHSVMFELVNFSRDKMQKSIEEGNVILYKRESEMRDLVNIENNIPTLKQVNENIFIKFSYLLEPRIVGSNLKNIKYIVLCKINLEDNILELRFDRVPQGYHTIKDFYVQMVNDTIARLHNLFDIKVNNIDFKAIIEYIRFIEDDKIVIYAMEMHRNGSKAYLDSMSNSEMIIPILGELKKFIDDNKELFDLDEETLKIKGKLKEFIENIEVTSDLPSIKIAWPEKNINIGIKHNYKGEEYSLIMYFNELIDSKEKMDYVREYFIQRYRELKQEV